jgi:hypothetical protein
MVVASPRRRVAASTSAAASSSSASSPVVCVVARRLGGGVVVCIIVRHLRRGVVVGGDHCGVTTRLNPLAMTEWKEWTKGGLQPISFMEVTSVPISLLTEIFSDVRGNSCSLSIA